MPEENKQLKLRELIDITTKYVKGEIDSQELADFGNQMTIRSYIPIQEKMGMVMGLMVSYQFSDVSTQEIKVGELYRALFFYVLLGGYGMVDCSDIALINYDNYDLLYPIFAPFILSYCRDDYEMVKEFIRDTINMYNLNEMTDLFANLDVEELKKTSEENKKIFEQFEQSKEAVKDLKDIMDFNDPMTAKVVQELKDSVRKKVIEKVDNSEEK